jgi:hypothetical protein
LRHHLLGHVRPPLRPAKAVLNLSGAAPKTTRALHEKAPVILLRIIIEVNESDAEQDGIVREKLLLFACNVAN